MQGIVQQVQSRIPCRKPAIQDRPKVVLAVRAVFHDGGDNVPVLQDPAALQIKGRKQALPEDIGLPFRASPVYPIGRNRVESKDCRQCGICKRAAVLDQCGREAGANHAWKQ